MNPPSSPFTVPFDGGFRVADHAIPKRPITPEKFSKSDLAARADWTAHMAAHEAPLNETSRPHAPRFAIPADDKPFMRLSVSRIVADTLEAMALRWPSIHADELASFDEHIAALEGENS